MQIMIRPWLFPKCSLAGKYGFEHIAEVYMDSLVANIYLELT